MGGWAEDVLAVPVLNIESGLALQPGSVDFCGNLIASRQKVGLQTRKVLLSEIAEIVLEKLSQDTNIRKFSDWSLTFSMPT